MRRIDDDFDIFRKIMKDFFGNSDFSGGFKFRDDEKQETYSSNGVDIFKDDKHIYVTVELRVPDEDMKITPQSDGILMEVMYKGMWRRWKIDIPRLCNPKTAKITYINGILDVTLDIDEAQDGKV